MRNIARTGMTALAIVASVALSAPAHSADEVNVAPGLTYAGVPLGLHGIDPVALVSDGQHVEGNAEFTGKHGGVAYYFFSAANLSAFQANPSKFIPENGGFCTFGVSVGKKFDGDPEFAAVVDNKLYVFLNEAIFNEFKKDDAGTISKAAKNWPEIKHVPATDL